MFRQDFTCPALLKDCLHFTYTGLSPALAGLSRPFYLSSDNHWPVPRSLATTSGISVDVFSSRVLRCFSSPGSPRHTMYSCADTRCRVGCPIRISTDQRLLAAPRGFSQRATSFIASWCQGIHRMPFLYSISRPLPEGRRLTMHRNHPQAQLSGFSRQLPEATATETIDCLRTVLEISTPHTTGFSRIAPPWPPARAPREIRQNRSQRL